MTVHNHGPEDGEGLNCRELAFRDGLRGVCLDNDLKSRLVYAALDALTDDDPILVVGISERQIVLDWNPRISNE